MHGIELRVQDQGDFCWERPRGSFSKKRSEIKWKVVEELTVMVQAEGKDRYRKILCERKGKRESTQIIKCLILKHEGQV